MFREIISLIEENESICIFGHVHPDGDCYGSQIGLKELILTRYPGKKVYAVGSGLPDFFSLIGKMDIVSDETIKKSLAIIVDSNDLPRIEDKRVKLAKAFAKIDHHVDTNTFHEGPEVVVEDANSVSEIVCELAFIHNIEINKTAANALYLGILTDTNRFQYCNKFDYIFDVCKQLISHGAEPSKLYEILNMREESFLKFAGYVYSNYHKTEGGTLYFVFDKEAIKYFEPYDALDVANKVNLIGNIKGYKVWVGFVEREDGRLSAEFRSNELDVQSIAVKYGGGGHVHAAGMTVAKFDKEFIKQILKECDELIAKGN